GGRGRVRAADRALATRSYRRDIEARKAFRDGYNLPSATLSILYPYHRRHPYCSRVQSHHDFAGSCGLDHHATSVLPTPGSANSRALW
ncbi:hypothetical protein WH47_09302, partial [Habropoda laboriosa]